MDVQIVMPSIYTSFPFDLSLLEHLVINDLANNRIDYLLQVLMYNLPSLRTLDLVGVSNVFSIDLMYDYMIHMPSLESVGLITLDETTYDELEEFICEPNFYNIRTFRLNLWEHVEYEVIFISSIVITFARTHTYTSK